MNRAVVLLVALVVFGRVADAEEGEATVSEAPYVDPVCEHAHADPVTTPLRDVAIDAQRSACLRDDIAVHVLAAALIDTPGFHGEIDGELRLFGRTQIARHWELDLGVRMVRYAFVQNAVSKGSATQFGPFSVAGMYANRFGDSARGALVATLELPYTRDRRDTLHISGELTGVMTAALSSHVLMNARLGWLAMHAHSAGGVTHRMAFRAGLDLVRRFERRLSVQLGSDMQAGWHDGFDHVLVRVGAHWVFGGRWRGAVGVGVPVGGDERTNAVLDLGITRDLR